MLRNKYRVLGASVRARTLYRTQCHMYVYLTAGTAVQDQYEGAFGRRFRPLHAENDRSARSRSTRFFSIFLGLYFVSRMIVVEGWLPSTDRCRATMARRTLRDVSWPPQGRAQCMLSSQGRFSAQPGTYRVVSSGGRACLQYRLEKVLQYGKTEIHGCPLL